MVGKNNQWLLKKKMGQRYTRWSLRRLSIGVVSVAVSSRVFLFSNMMLDPVAHAAITDTPTIATPASASATTTPTATTTDSSASTTSQASARQRRLVLVR
ncbi:YSIRK-type signal peptide-containing protein [Limosilactobacillus fermentum]